MVLSQPAVSLVELAPTGAAQRYASNRRTQDDSSEVLAQAQRLLARGAAREAIQLLTRCSVDGECTLPGTRGAEAGVLLAVCFGMLGHHDDAREWLVRAHRHALAHRAVPALNWIGPVHAALAHLAGDDVIAIRLGNQYLAQTASELRALSRAIVLIVMGASYLRLGQIEKCRLCSEAARDGASTGAAAVGLAAALASWLAGEVELARYVQTTPSARAHVLMVHEAGVDDTLGVLPRRALEHFAAAEAQALHWTLVRDWARLGSARARLAIHLTGRDEEADWRLLQRHATTMGALGCTYEHDRTVLHIGVARLMRGDSKLARQALVGLSGTVLAGAACACALDALYYGAVACQASGDAAGASARLVEFMARLRARHLLRAALPPPLLEGPASQSEALGGRTQNTDLDDILITRVTALVREDPTQSLSSDGLAVLFGVSRRTLQYRFRRATGKTPKEFVTELRVEQARELLGVGGDLARAELERVAGSAGFPTYRSFVRAFRAICAQSPAEYIVSHSDDGGALNAAPKRTRSRKGKTPASSKDAGVQTAKALQAVSRPPAD